MNRKPNMRPRHVARSDVALSAALAAPVSAASSSAAASYARARRADTNPDARTHCPDA